MALPLETILPPLLRGRLKRIKNLFAAVLFRLGLKSGLKVQSPLKLISCTGIVNLTVQRLIY